MVTNINRTNQVIRIAIAIGMLVLLYGRFIQVEYVFLYTLFAIGLLITSANRFSPIVFGMQLIQNLIIRD